MSHIAFNLSKLNFVSSCVVYVMVLYMVFFNLKKDTSTDKNKNVIHQRCWFVKKTFSNAHVNVHGVKCFILNNVWLLLSMLNTSFWSKLV
ncbi:hypothetical protein AB205_0188040 [Aquarana catesbeiana]|uniref:Uncharacterized protein n=1 Tax=Aquarana catesbeiana TaxID=8400 RepID=A0A2G9R5N3_AQUCT|nr:hypothetical protein AB205_0188040 [Aquarana catesbeiana]